MFDVVAADKFLNSLFGNILPHLDKIKSEAAAAATPLALQYAETNDPKHRAAYQGLKARTETVRKFCRVMLDDPSTGVLVRQSIYKLFPDMDPKQVAQVAPAKVVTAHVEPGVDAVEGDGH